MKRKGSARGTALAELAAAAAFVAVALVGTIAAIGSGSTLAKTTAETREAQRVAASLMEEIRSTDVDDLVATYHGATRTLDGVGKSSSGAADVVVQRIDNGLTMWAVYEVTRQAVDVDHTSAYGQHGPIMLEFVQQNCDNPSVFTGRPFGIHRVAMFAESFDDELARMETLGFPVAWVARTQAGGMRYAFADANAWLGHYIEIYEDNQGVRDFYAMVAAAAEDWDGSDPIR